MTVSSRTGLSVPIRCALAYRLTDRDWHGQDDSERLVMMRAGTGVQTMCRQSRPDGRAGCPSSPARPLDDPC
jgi:hypothetical protein